MNSELTGHVKDFSGRSSPRLVLAALVVAVAARARKGRLTRSDLAVAAVIVGLQPFTEWVIHTFVLHFRPRRVRGRSVDLHAARKHREHHLDPSNLDKVLVPLPDLATAGVLIVGLSTALNRTAATRLTAMATSLSVLLTYEWTHYLIHTTYRPRSRHVRSIWRSHRLHHYRNENHWMGVTSNLADRVLGTFPDRSEVPLSPTARTLGVAPHGEGGHEQAGPVVEEPAGVRRAG